MAKYSTQADITDDLIKGLSKLSDHEEAADYVDKILVKCGIEVGENDSMSQLMGKLAVTYAMYKRAFYESTTKQDVFYQKYLGYEKELMDLTGQLIKSLTNTTETPLDRQLKTATEVLLDVLAGVKYVAAREELTLHALKALINPCKLKIIALQEALIELSSFVSVEHIADARKIINNLK